MDVYSEVFVIEPTVRDTTKQGAQLPRFCSVADAARLLGMSEVTLYRAIHSGQFPAIKIRGRYVIPARVLEAMEDAAVSSGAMVDAADWATDRGAA